MGIRTLHRTAAGAALALACIITPAIGAPQVPPPDPPPSMGELIQQVAKATGKRFLYQQRVTAVKVYGQIPDSGSPETLWKLFHSALEMNGFAVATIAAGKPHEVHKIVDARNMRRYGTPTFSAEQVLKDPAVIGDIERFVTVIAHLKHASAREVANALRPLLDPNMGGQIIGIDRAEALIITDYAPNISRLLRVLTIADAAPVAIEGHVVIPVVHVTPAAAMAALEARVKRSRGMRVSIRTLDAVAGARGLSICTTPKLMPVIRRWLAEIDADPSEKKR